MAPRKKVDDHADASQLPSKSAWARGPPSSPRPTLPKSTRRPLMVPVWSDPIGHSKQDSAMTFGSIDNAQSLSPISNVRLMNDNEATTPGSTISGLQSNASVFVPKRVTIKSPSGQEIDMSRFKKTQSTAAFGSLPAVAHVPAAATSPSVRLETEEAKNQRVAEEEARRRAKRERKKAAKAARNGAQQEMTGCDTEGGGAVDDEEKTAVQDASREAARCEPEVELQPLTASIGCCAPIPPLSTLAAAQYITDIRSIVYPEAVNAPNSTLNVNATPGKFRYDRDFLLQFMAICKDEPAPFASLQSHHRTSALSSYEHDTLEAMSQRPDPRVLSIIRRSNRAHFDMGQFSHRSAPSRIQFSPDVLRPPGLADVASTIVRTTMKEPSTSSSTPSEAQGISEGSSLTAAKPPHPPSSMSRKEVEKRIEEASMTLFHLHDIDDALSVFSSLPPRYHSRLVDKLVSAATESTPMEAQLVAYFFYCVAEKSLCSLSAFEDGFSLTAAVLDDIMVDAPDALALFVTMVKGAGLHKEAGVRTRLASRTVNGDALMSRLSG